MSTTETAIVNTEAKSKRSHKRDTSNQIANRYRKNESLAWLREENLSDNNNAESLLRLAQAIIDDLNAVLWDASVAAECEETEDQAGILEEQWIAQRINEIAERVGAYKKPTPGTLSYALVQATYAARCRRQRIQGYVD